jgi:chromosome partitioning protein
MPVVAVVNRKGGSGKSTLAAHVAAWFAGQGLPAVLGDVDRQQSTQAWLKRRAAQPAGQRARLFGWNVDPRNVVRPPANAGHVVLDTPGGLRGFDLARVVMYADAILMPVCASAFDRESAAECVAELRALPRVASGRCRLAAVGMRIDARTRAEAVLKAWAEAIELPVLGVLRDTQAYVRCIEDGLTLFDLPPAKVAQDLAQWQPIVDWLAPLLQGTSAAPGEFDASSKSTAGREPVASAASIPVLARAKPAEARTGAAAAPARPVATAHSRASAEVEPAARTGTRSRSEPEPVVRPAAPALPASRSTTPVGRLLNALAIPRFLQRTP